MKSIVTFFSVFTLLFAFYSTQAQANHCNFKVTFTNLSGNVVLTPPIFATTKERARIYTLTEPASEALEMLAEGGETNGLAAYLSAHDLIDVVQTGSPVLPGQSVTIVIKGRFYSYLSVASMILPTNDGFVALNGKRIFKPHRQTYYLTAYDAGTEVNDESCAHIPGPQCGGSGEGFNGADGEGFVFPHAGIHGEGDLLQSSYNWGEPVAKVTVTLAY